MASPLDYHLYKLVEIDLLTGLERIYKFDRLTDDEADGLNLILSYHSTRTWIKV